MSSKKDYESVLKFISGGVAGMIAKTIVAPIDRTKFLFMGTIRHFTIQSLLQELKRIKIEEGIKSYWKGNLAQLLRVFPYSGIQFLVYGKSEKILNSRFSDNNYGRALSKFLSGSLAGTSAVLLTYPFDVARTRLAYQTTGKIYNGVFHAFYTMAVKEKFGTLFRGISPTLFGMGIYGGTTFSIFFTLKNSVANPGKIEIFTFGAFAGLLGQILSYPFDVVRKRMMAKGFIEKVSNYKSSFEGDKLSGMMSYFYMILKHEGYKGLLKGITMNFIKAPIMLGTVHLSNHLINKSFGEE